MVISKCVPLAISRKQFSDFEINTNPQQMIFVGYKNIEGKRFNVQMEYSRIKQDIIRYIDQNGGLGGGGGAVTPPEEGTPSEGVTPVKYTHVKTIPVTLSYNDEGELERGETWSDEYQTNMLDVAGMQGLIEINAGGDYTEDYVYVVNPVWGAITHIVVDNTGLPNPNSPTGYDEPITDFTLYYGSMSNSYEILNVPVGCRGVVQILHTEDMKLDIILHSSYSSVPDGDKYVVDSPSGQFRTNNPIDMTPESDGNTNEFYINMAEQKGYIEFPTGDSDEYTFVFAEPELGSSTYIVINNTKENYYGKPVNIRYGKVLDENKNGIADDGDLEIVYDVTTVDDELCVIEVFHSLSADIIVKITKM